MQDETSVKRKLVEKSPEIAKSPPTLTAAVVVPKVKKKEEVSKEIFTTATTTEDEDEDEEDDSDHPPSEKKLKIDLENDTIKVKVTANDVKKVEKNDIKVKVTANDVKKVEKNDIKVKVTANDVKKVEKNDSSSNNKSSSIKLKVMANDVKKVEKLAGNSNSNPIVKSEKKPEIVVQPSSVKKEEVIDRKKPIQTGSNGTTANNSVKSTTATSPKSPIIQQESVVKPKLTNGSAAKSRDGNKKLYDIVNNLSKKQASLNNSPQHQPGKKDSSIGKKKRPKILGLVLMLITGCFWREYMTNKFNFF